MFFMKRLEYGGFFLPVFRLILGIIFNILSVKRQFGGGMAEGGPWMMLNGICISDGHKLPTDWSKLKALD